MRHRPYKIVVLLVFLLASTFVAEAIDVPLNTGFSHTTEDAAKANAKVLAGELDRSWVRRVVGGINKKEIYKALIGDAVYRTALQKEYSILTNSDLRSHLNRLGKDDGNDVIAAYLLLDQGQLTTIDKIFLHTHGFGTKEKLLFSDLAEIKGEKDRSRFQNEWLRKFGPDGFYYQGPSSAVAAIEGDLSGEDERLALKLYRAEPLSADELARVSEITGKNRDEVVNQQTERWAERASPPASKSREELVKGLKQKAQLPEEAVVQPQLPAAQPLPPAECGPGEKGYRLCVGLPGQPRDVADLGDYIRLLYQFALGIAGIVVFARVVYGGILYISSAGNISNRKDATEIITQAIFGLVLLLAAVLILYMVDPRLLDLRQALKSTDLSESSFNFNLVRPNPPL